MVRCAPCRVPGVEGPDIETRPNVIGWSGSEKRDDGTCRLAIFKNRRATSTMKKATTLKKTTLKKSKSGSMEGEDADSASQLIDTRIKELADWRGETLARIRSLIKEACPEVIEEWKWRGVPVWSHAGIICTGETYKSAVKMTFAKGASLADPSGLFNASLEGNTRRAIDFHEGQKIDEVALKALIRAAAALNTSVRAAARPVRSQKTPETKDRSRSVVKPAAPDRRKR